jgi:predicted permease
MLQILATELRHAWRAIANRPAFSALVVGVLALGLACVTYVASIVNGMVVEPLPFASPERLYYAGLIDNDDHLATDELDSPNVDELLDWRERLAGQAEIAGYAAATVNFSDGERPERHSGARATANLFTVLGVAPAMGRGFSEADERPGAAPVVVISDSLWRSRYLADPQIIGRMARVNARAATIVGVMPPEFSFPRQEQAWIPAELQRGVADPLDLAVVIRAGDGVPGERLRALLDGWLADAVRENPTRMASRARGIGFRPLAWEFVDGETRALFAVMGAAVFLVLLIACANVANLLLSQLMSRQQELAVRSALGASRRRLALQLLAQTGLLAAIALLVALPLAQVMVGATEALFRQSVEDGPPHWMHFRLDQRVIGLAVAAAALTALLSGILPALRAGSAAGSLVRDGERGSSGAVFARVSRALVIGEIALSCALLIAAAVLVEGVRRLDRFDLGLRTEGVLTARIGLFPDRFPDDASMNRYTAGLLERLRADPAVVDAAISSSLPGLMGDNVDVLPEGAPVPPNGTPNPGFSAVDDGFLRAMGATLVAGRFFGPQDTAASEMVAVVDEDFAAKLARSGTVLGQRFVLDPQGATPRAATVVGVIRPVQMDDIDDTREPSLLVPYAQRPTRFFSVLVRTRADAAGFGAQLAAHAQALDADTPAYWVRTYDIVLREATFGERVLVRVFGAFGLVALGLATAGLYGVIAFSVGQRTREIGVRRALGAPDRRVLAAVAGRSAWQIGLGLALGVAVGIPFARMLAAPIAHVVEVTPSSALSVVLVLGVVAALATWIPARRALRIEPLAALRHD